MSSTAARSPATGASLSTSEAVDLAHAWLQALADAHGIRVLFIKGPTLHRLGLRAPRQSSDVDVLVDPAAFEAFRTLMRDAGWRERLAGTVWAELPHHSRTYLIDGWPCDVDVHSHFPGFLADPQVTFEALWDTRGTLSFAGRECAVPSRSGAAMVLALHSLRSTPAQSRHDAELAQLTSSAQFTPSEKSAIAELASRTASTVSLAPLLSHIGASIIPDAVPTSPELTRAWQMRTRTRGIDGGGYLEVISLLSELPLTLRLRALVRLFWPRGADLAVNNPGLDDTVRARNAARLTRLGRALSQLPRTLINRPR